MGLAEFKVNLQNLRETAKVLIEKNVDMGLDQSNVHDFRTSRHLHYKKRYYMTIELLKQELANIKKLDPALQIKLTTEVHLLDNCTLEKTLEKTEYIAELISNLKEEERSEVVKIPKKLPSEISKELVADIEEIHKCFDVEAYRAVVILCGRVLETTLHWKYYNKTGFDLLEKSPGIGLGNLIAKLRDKNIEFDPGITQQIHLINQVRVFSVHTKKETFKPSKNQAEAILLYTMDVLEKLVK